MNILKTTVGLIIFAILNTIYIKNFSIFGIMPNLLAIIIVLIGSYKGRTEGGIYGLLVGILNDILVGTSFGLYGLIYMYVGFVAGVMAKKMYNENMIISTLMIAVADIFYNVTVYFYYYLPKDYSFIDYLLRAIVPEMLYTVLVFVGASFIIGQLKRQYSRAF